MDNPFIISSAALSKEANLVSFVDMELLKDGQGNGSIFRISKNGLEELFIINREIIDMAISENDGQLLVLTHEVIYLFNSLSPTEKPIDILQSGSHGYFKKMKVFDNTIYIITMSDSIIKFDKNNGSIKDISPNITESYGIENLFLSDGKLKYATGWNGLIMEFSGTSWIEIPSPVNKVITSMDRLENDDYILVGQSGDLLLGDMNVLQNIDHDWSGYDFWDVISHEKRVFILSEIGVLELTGEEVNPVVGRPQEKSIFFTFKHYKNKLWAVGQRNILEYKEDKWKDIITLD